MLISAAGKAGFAALLLPAALVTTSPRPTVIRDPADTSPACKDIRTVRVVATTSRVSFKVVMGAKPAARPCRSQTIPVVFIDTNSDGNSDCQATASNGSSDVRCGSSVTGNYRTAIDAKNPLQWDLSFPTKAIGPEKSFRVQLATITNGQFNDLAPDGNAEATVKVG